MGHPGTATATLLVENDRTRVTEWRFPRRGDNTGWHRHEYDYVVVPLHDGALRIETAEGTTAAQLAAGGAYFRAAGVEHDVISDNDAPFAFVEIEFLK